MVVLNYDDVEMSSAFIGYVYEQCLIKYTKESFRSNLRAKDDELIITEVN